MELLKNITIGQYVPGESPVHRLDPRVKILLLFIIILDIFLLKLVNLWEILLPAFFLFMVILSSGLSIGYVLRGLRSVLVLVLITFCFNIFFYDGTPIYRFYMLTITKEGIVFGSLMAARIVYIVLATSLLTLTTSPLQITDGLESLMKWGKRIHIPVHEIALMMSIALRFIPTLMEQLEKIIKAQMARGAELEKGSIIQRARNFIPILVPLFVQAFRHADDLAIAMEARCYRGGEGRTRLRVFNARGSDLLAVLVTGIYSLGQVIAAGLLVLR